jgi:hypothetical protein
MQMGEWSLPVMLYFVSMRGSINGKTQAAIALPPV